MNEAIETGIAPSRAPISDCVRAGNHVWMVAVSEDPKTGTIVTGEIEVQARQVLSNLKQCIEAAGGTMGDIVMMQIFLIDSANSAGMNKVYREFITEKPYPVRATVVVKELLAQGLKMEATAMAVLQGPKA